MILQIDLENYRCYAKYSYSFNDKLNIISGANGIGKTTIIEAIAYALFGNKATRGKANEWIREGSTHGKVKLYLDDYIITRGDKEQLVEQLDGTLLAKQHVGIDAWVEETYGLNIDLYSTANYIAQKDIESFSGLQPIERVNRVEKLLKIDVLDVLKKNTKEQLKPLVKEVDTLSNKIDNNFSFDFDKGKESLAKLKADSIILAAQYKEALKKQGAYTKALDLYNKKIILEKKTSSIVYKEIDLSLDELISVKRRLEKSNEAQEKLSQYTDIISSDVQFKLESTREQYSAVSSKLKELTTITEKCPTCGQLIPDFAHVLEEKSLLEQKLKDLKESGKLYKQQMEKYELEKLLYVSSYDLDKINQMLKDIQAIPYLKQLEEYSDVTCPKKINADKVNTDYEDVLDQISVLELSIINAEKIKLVNDTYTDEYVKKIARLQKMKSFVEFIDSYRREFTQNIIPLIETNSAKIFHYLTDNKYSEFELQKDYSLKDYHKLSGSEADCASLAIRMAIAKISRIGNFDSILLDEVSASFDSGKEELLLDLLKLSKAQLIYISHGSVAQ